MLLLWQRLARSDPELPFDQIYTGNHFGHRVLDLETGIHLHEIEFRSFDQKLNRSSADIADRFGQPDRGIS